MFPRSGPDPCTTRSRHGSTTISIAGADVTRADPALRDVALVFQNFSLYPGWSVRKNLEFPLRAPGRNLAAAEIAERVHWAARLLCIEPLLLRPAERLSGGEMQRVAIGRAIVRRPRLFLFDEPLSNLDAKLRESLRVELASLVRELGVPALYVTHDQAEALSMADRIAVLCAGRILQSGSREEIYERPSSPTVARLLGEPPINLFPLRSDSGHWRAPDGRALLATTAPPGTTALAGIRPEHVLPHGGPSPARIEVVEERGPDRILLARWSGHPLHVLVPRTGTHRPGDLIHPSFALGHMLVWESDGLSNSIPSEPTQS